MSTHDPKGGPPPGLPPVGEVSLLTAHLPGGMPRTTETPNYPVAAMTSTPGFSLGAVRSPPGAPTLPELDPMSLTNAISQLANQMFSAPPTAAEPPSPQPYAHAPEPRAADPRTGETRALEPGAPAFDAFTSPMPPVQHFLLNVPGSTPLAAHFPLHESFDAPAASAAPNAPVAHANHAPAVPSTAQTHPGAHVGPVAAVPSRTAVPDQRYSFDTFEIVPTHVPSAPAASHGTRLFDANVLKKEFPILSEPVRGKRLVWLDNGATTQKPRTVIDRISYFYEHENSNIHRAAHTLAGKATDAYEAARESVRRFINAPSVKDIVFVRGTTEGINFIAQSWGRRNVREGDEIVISHLEHHANIVPWQQLCSEKRARLLVAPVDSRGQVILEEYEKLLGPRTRIVSFTQVSNALGTITPAAEMTAMAKRHGAVVLVDGAQAVSHMPVDVQAIGCDFYVFSGHKVFAPTGIGAVFGRSELLEAMPPWQGGGNMIQDVTFERTTYQPPPARFEAGTGNIADAVGLGAALDWLTRVGIHNVERYEHDLLEYGTHALSTVPGLTLIGTAARKAGVMSFVLDGQKTEEVGGMLDQEGIAVRSGHHCAQPILRRFGLEATVRASLAPYNTYEDIDTLVAALRRIQLGRGR